MAIFNVGSINIDHFYAVSHLPEPGETLAAGSYRTGLGGKGANQSAAAAKAGAQVLHVGAVGPEGGWAIDRLAGWGVGTAHVARLDTPTGHAIINVDAGGENTIVLFPGANWALPEALVRQALVTAGAGDTLLLQNETAHQVVAAGIGRDRGMRVIYSAAPFDLGAVRAILPHVSMLAMNAVEAEQLCTALGLPLENLPVPEILVTRGADGAEWHDLTSGERVFEPARKVAAVDTTGAGDTFVGYFAAALDAGRDPGAALALATAAAALKVTRPGTADSIPTAAEVAGLASA